MNKKILVALLMVCITISTVTVFADTTVKYEQSGDKIILSGTTTEDDAILAVFRKEDFTDSEGSFDVQGAYTALDNASDKASVLVYSNQADVTDGAYSFALRIVHYPGLTAQQTVSGIYTAVVDCGDDSVTMDMLYVSPSERDSALASLALLSSTEESARKSAVTSFIKQNKYTLGIYKDGFDMLTPALLDTMLYDKTEEFAYDFTMKDEYISELKKIVAISLLNDSKMSSVDNFKEELGLLGNKFKPWYTRKFVDADFKSAITLRLSAKGINGGDTFDKKLAEALVLLYAEKADGIGDIKDIVNTFKGEFGATSSWSDEAFRSVMGTKFETCESLFSALSSYGSGSGQVNSNTGNANNNKNNGGGINISAPAVSAQGNTAVHKTEFHDVSREHWASSAVYALRDKGIIAGKTTDVFAPDDNITREEFVKLIVALLDIKATSDTPEFTDVAPDAWYAPYLRSAYSCGVIKGSSDGSFGTGKPITRQDMAVMIYRALNADGTRLSQTKGESEFNDAYEIADYAIEAMASLQCSGVISGYTDGSVRPLGLATRAEAAQMIYNITLLK